MKITNIYQEDGIICMHVEGFDRTIYLDDHADNRALLKAFEEAHAQQPEPESNDDYAEPDLTYVIASTSYMANETYIFPANENGEITSYGEVGGLAERWGCEEWDDPDATMRATFGNDHRYEKVAETRSMNGPQTLYKLVTPTEADSWNGDETNHINHGC